jgi:hypothetical protein
MKRVIKWDHYYYHHVNIYIDADNPPFVDYFPRETMGFQWVFHIYVNVYPGGVTHGT